MPSSSSHRSSLLPSHYQSSQSDEEEKLPESASDHDSVHSLPSNVEANFDEAPAAIQTDEPPPVQPPLKLVVLTTARYDSLQDPRFGVALATAHRAADLQLPLWVIDESPLAEIATQLEQAGRDPDGTAMSWVKVLPPFSKKETIRDGFLLAYEAMKERHPDHLADCVICVQDVEQTDLLRHWRRIVDGMRQEAVDIGVPAREPTLLAESYPTEHYHADAWANAYLNSLASDMPTLDWTLGALALTAPWVPVWLEGKGRKGPLVSLIRTVRQRATIESYEVDFRLSPILRQEEEGSSDWSEERLKQLQQLFDKVGNELKKNRLTI